MNDKGVLIRQPTILGPDGQPIAQMDHPVIAARKAAAAATAPTKADIAAARAQAAQMGFRIIKQSENTRKGNIRRAKKAELRRTLKGTGKSFADHYAEQHEQQRREEHERRTADAGN
jgi:hypothetical protein